MAQQLLVRRSAGAEPVYRGIALELGTSLPTAKLSSVTGTGIASSEAFGVASITQRKTVSATSIASSEAFGASSAGFPKGAAGPHPTTNDTRTTVTGPEDLSGKNFTNTVTISGSGITGNGVAFARKPLFQDVTADLRNVWFDQNTGFGLAGVLGLIAATNVTIRRFTGLQFQGDMIDIEGAFVGTVSLYNGLLRPAALVVSNLTTLTGISISSSEAFGTSTLTRKNNLTAAGLASSQAFGTASLVQLGGPNVATPSSLGPSSPIVTTFSAATPAYTIQVKADGTLKRSDTGASISIAGTEFTGGTLIIETDTPGTRRTPIAGSLQNIRVRAGKLIFRDLNVTTAMGQGEVTDSSADAAIEWQGCNGVMGHWRAVKCTGGGLRFTKSPSGLYSGQNTPAAGAWSAFNITNPATPIPTPALRVDNVTAHAASGATGAALTFDRALNVYVGGFDAGSQSTPAGLWPIAVKYDAAGVAGGTKLDVQDCYVGKALDGTDTKLSSKAGTPTLWPGVMKRSGVDAAVFPNTLGSRPEIPIWFALSNGVTLATATSANTTNDRVVAEHFVLRNALAENLVNSTARDGSTRLQQFEVTKTVYDPAASLTLWTPTDIADTWPNGIRRFIHPCAVKNAIGPRPTTAATMPNGTTLQNKSVIDATWTHMGGVAGDGVTEILDRKFDPDLMIDGVGTAGKRFKSTIGTGVAASGGGGIQLIAASNTLIDSTPRTLVVKKPDGTAPDLSGWDSSGGFGIYTGYFDPAKPNEVDTGMPYRRQIKYTGIDTTAGAFTGCTLVPRPTTTPAQKIPDGEIIRIVAGVAETFFPHGLPTGDTVDVATGGLTGTGFTVTRVDDYHFLINGQTGVTWNVAGQVGTFTPQTAHAYGLAGTDNSVTIPAGTTLDDTQNINMGQPISNVIIQVKSGQHVRFVRCTLGDTSFQAQDDTCIIELVDCDMPVTAVPGKYDYDEPGNLGVAGKYDPANQHQWARMVANTNVIVSAGSLFLIDGLVSFGTHGDFCQGIFKLGSVYNQVHIEHGRDVAAPTSGGSQTRNGIPGTWPKVTAGPHGDIQQWYDKAAPLVKASVLATSAHSIEFSRFEKNYIIYGPSIKITAASGTPIQLTLETAQTWNTGDVVSIIDNGAAAGTTYLIGPTQPAGRRTMADANALPLAPGDTVLFDDSVTWTSFIAPPASGVAGSPITYGKFGSTRTRVLFHGVAAFITGRSYIRFQDIESDMQGVADACISISSSGASCTNISLYRCRLHNTPEMAINQTHGPVPGGPKDDSDWYLEDCIIEDTGDSGIINYGSRMTLFATTDDAMVIRRTGTNLTGPGRHGIYADGPGLRIGMNGSKRVRFELTGANGKAVSFRSHDQLIGNVLFKQCQQPFGFDPNDPSGTPGVIGIYDSVIDGEDPAGVGPYLFYYDDVVDPTSGVKPPVDVEIANLTVINRTSNGLDIANAVNSGRHVLLRNIAFCSTLGYKIQPGITATANIDSDWNSFEGGGKPSYGGTHSIQPAANQVNAATYRPQTGSPLSGVGTLTVSSRFTPTVADIGFLGGFGSAPASGTGYSEWTVTKVGTGPTSTQFILQGSSGSAARFVNGHVSLKSELPTVSLDAATGSAKVTLAGGAKHNFNDGDTLMIKFSGDAALNREWVAKKSGNSAVVAQGSVFRTGGPAVLVHTIHLVIPGVLRSDILTAKMVDTSDVTRLGPISSKGNVSINISLTATDPWGTTAIVPGELDLVAVIRENRIMTIDGPAGTWSLPVAGSPSDYDIANNAWTDFGQQGAAIPSGLATPTLD